jgi:hypothetical protein
VSLIQAFRGSPPEWYDVKVHLLFSSYCKRC